MIYVVCIVLLFVTVGFFKWFLDLKELTEEEASWFAGRKPQEPEVEVIVIDYDPPYVRRVHHRRGKGLGVWVPTASTLPKEALVPRRHAKRPLRERLSDREIIEAFHTYGPWPLGHG